MGRSLVCCCPPLPRNHVRLRSPDTLSISGTASKSFPPVVTYSDSCPLPGRTLRTTHTRGNLEGSCANQCGRHRNLGGVRETLFVLPERSQTRAVRWAAVGNRRNCVETPYSEKQRPTLSKDWEAASRSTVASKRRRSLAVLRGVWVNAGPARVTYKSR